MSALTAAMRLAERGRFGHAVAAFALIAGPRGDGVIARFRRAECLSRIGRHDEAVAEARQAHADAPDTPATALWLAQALAEAGRFDEAAAVRHPDEHVQFVGPVAAGYAALAKLAADVPDDRDAVVDGILESRHAPIYSLALRICERRRVAREPRAPDLPSIWYREECRLEREEDGIEGHPAAPVLDGLTGCVGMLRRPSRRSDALRWLRLHAGCDDWSASIASLRAAKADADAVDEIELEMLLALGRLDAAEALASRMAKGPGGASGELSIDRCRIAQLRGRPARPSEFEGYEDVKRRRQDAIAWLECVAALIEGRETDARAAAEGVADPSHREFVEAALLRWRGGEDLAAGTSA